MKTALVTGATAGIGAATVRAMAGAGWQVVATGRRADRLEALAGDFDGRVHTAAFDVRDADAAGAAIEALPEGFRGIDLLVNNAGLALGTKPAQESSLADWRTMIDTNVTALVAITHRLLPTLIERKGGIINLSSVAATYPYTGGNQQASDTLYAGAEPMTAEDIAATVLWIATLPPHLNINSLELMPVSQSFAGFQVARKG